MGHHTRAHDSNLSNSVYVYFTHLRSTCTPLLWFLWSSERGLRVWNRLSIIRGVGVVGVDGFGVCSNLPNKKVAGSNTVVTNPERGASRALLNWVSAISFGRLSRMIGKQRSRVKWGGSLLKDLESCKDIFQLCCKNLGKYQMSLQLTFPHSKHSVKGGRSVTWLFRAAGKIADKNKEKYSDAILPLKLECLRPLLKTILISVKGSCGKSKGCWFEGCPERAM